MDLKVKEINKLLNDSEGAIIWEQKVSAGNAVFQFGLYTTIYGFILYFYLSLFRKVGIINLFNEDIVLFSELVSIILLALFFIILYTSNVHIATTIKYSILPKEINFKWGLINKQNISIPFKNIETINLVKYNNSNFSTIYFGTTQAYKIRKMNFDTAEARALITFEKIREGDKVLELLNLLWEKEIALTKKV